MRILQACCLEIMGHVLSFGHAPKRLHRPNGSGLRSWLEAIRFQYRAMKNELEVLVLYCQAPSMRADPEPIFDRKYTN